MQWEIHTEKLRVMHKRINEHIDKGLKTIFGAFKDTTNQVDLLCLRTRFPWSKLVPENVVKDDTIIGDSEFPK